MPRRKIWEVPALHYEEEYGIERKVTWLELFFDLMFVVMISQTSAKLKWQPLCCFISDFFFKNIVILQINNWII